MKLGLRLLFAFFVINGLAAFFILRVFTAEIKPSARQVMEDLLVDTAYILAELASQDLAAGQMTNGQFAQQVSRYATRSVNASIWGMRKQSLDYRIYVTDPKGIVVFDSENRALGQDYSNWRDVALTLRGEYGARATREVANDERTGVMYVAAPVLAEGQLIGVLAVAKPARTVQVFIDRAERKIFLRGLLLLALSAAVGIAVTCWLVWNIRKLRHYALNAEAGHKLAAPRVPGEFGDLAAALETMRARLEGRDYVEAYVQALTHELKSPVAAIRGAGELLLDDLPPADRGIFAQQIVEQTQRVQRLIERLLDLSKLEQRQALAVQTPINLSSCTHAAIAHIRDRATQKNTRIDCTGVAADGLWEAELVTMAVSNLLAIVFNMRMTASARSLSRGAVGSSARITGGRLIRPLAIATRCCSPPDSCDGMALARCSTSSEVRSSMARRRASSLGVPASMGSKATLSVTSRKGMR